jgi:CubicO group peptidase (beta-lactamase class C family)
MIAALSATTAAGQRAAPKPTAAAVGGVSQERFKRLDAVLQEHVDRNRIAGIVIVVLKDGRAIYERALGWSDKEAKRPMTADTIFRIASQTKALTSAAILALMEEGRLMPSMPVSRFIPAYAKTTVAVKGEAGASSVPARRAITIADLLTHTAGISYGTDELVAAQYEAKGLGPAAGFGWYTADKDEEVCATMERLATVPFVAQPGESYVYGYNTDILGCVVERASGMPLDEFIAEKITTPLGMKDTRFFLPPADRARLATVYGSGPDGTIVRAPEGARERIFLEAPACCRRRAITRDSSR